MPRAPGDYVLITGNQLGSLHLDYILLTRRELGLMPRKPAVVKTIVTTDLQARIAEKYGATCFECLTGFKWIADLMRRFESDGLGYEYVYGTEESYGHLVENEVRDKDGISAAALTAEMTLYWRSVELRRQRMPHNLRLIAQQNRRYAGLAEQCGQRRPRLGRRRT